MADVLAGAKISAGYWPPPLRLVSNTAFNFTSTSPVDGVAEGGGVLAGTFLAPKTGRIHVDVGGGIGRPSGTGAGNERASIMYEIYIGTSAGGSLLYPVASSRRITQGGPIGQGPWFAGRGSVLDGLTPLAVHYIRCMVQREGDTTGTTMRILQRTIDVMAAP